MPFVEARCKNCNAPLILNTAIKQANCLHCGTPYLMEDIIQNINFNISHPYSSGGDHSAELTVEMKMKLNAAEASLRLGRYEDALLRFRTLSDDIPQDYRVWWGQIRAMTCEFTAPITDKAELEQLQELYTSMLLFLPPQKREDVEQQFQDYYRSQQQDIARRRKDLLSRAERLREEYADLHSCMEECRREVYLRADQIREYRWLPLAILIVLGILSAAPGPMAAAVIGCVLYLTVAEPLLTQQAEQWEADSRDVIEEFSARSDAIEQELSQIEEQLSKLKDCP